MLPLSSLPSKKYDYEYDIVQPYFYFENSEDFYHQQHGQPQPPASSEDIWKKFELLPTPPLSPSRRPSLFSLYSSTGDPYSSTAYQLEMVSEFRGDDVVNRSFICDGSKAVILQDCMWSKLKKVVSERPESLQIERRESSTSDSTDELNANYLQDLDTSASECIDPSVVFPYRKLAEKLKPSKVTQLTIVSMNTPPNSRSSSGSDSEDEEEEKKDKQTPQREIDAEPIWEMDYIKLKRSNSMQHIPPNFNSQEDSVESVKNSPISKAVGCISKGEEVEYTAVVDNFVTLCDLKHLQQCDKEPGAGGGYEEGQDTSDTCW